MLRSATTTLLTTLLSLAGTVSVVPVADAHQSSLTFACSDANLTEGFQWAKTTALGYVQTGRSPEYVPCYWAGYADQPACPNGWACGGTGQTRACPQCPYWDSTGLHGSNIGQGRRAFYLRDMAHHALGAHLLGLDNENAFMARTFAASATKARGYFPVWSFGFDGSVYPMDYVNDSYFVRELPEPFDLINRIGGLLDWSGGPRWYNEPTLIDFYRSTFGPGESFLALNDPHQTGIASLSNHPGNDIFTGVASYNEQAGAPLAMSGDAIGMQYGAELAHSRLARARVNGCDASANKDATCSKQLAQAAGAASEKRAQVIRTEYSKNWVSADGRSYIRGMFPNGTKLQGWGFMENLIPLVTGLAPSNTVPTDGSLAQLARAAKVECGGKHPEGQSLCSISEIRTQMSEAFFRYGRPDDALTVLQGFQTDPRKTYPEVSFTMVENCVAGLLGIAPSADQHTLRTRHRLPTSMKWAAASNIPVGGHKVAVRHELSAGNIMSTIVSHTAFVAPGPVSGPNGGDWGYDHADSRVPAPPLPPAPSPPAREVAPSLHLTVQLAGRHPKVAVDGETVEASVSYQEGDTRLPLSEINVTLPLGKSVTVSTLNNT